MAVLSTTIAVLFSLYGDSFVAAFGFDGPFRELMGHPYAMQLFGNVFGYLTVNRITTSYSRYWEGVTVIKNMHSKWADACGQILNFDQVNQPATDLTDEPFCRHIVRLFSQLSAMATMKLHVEESMEAIAFEELAAMRNVTALDEMKAKRQALLNKSFNKRSFFSRKSQGSASSCASVLPMEELSSGAISRQGTQAHCSIEALEAITKKHHEGGTPHGKMSHRAAKKAEVRELVAGMTPEEAEMIKAYPCPVLATAQRIQRAIITRRESGGVCAPPPIVSRVFQEISNGLLAYNNATKMKEVPVPFAYVQYNAVVLNVFAILCPIAMACFSGAPAIAGLLTFFVVGSFFAIFILANEMEDPFGSEDNDMPMLQYHEEFCANICAMLTHAWLPEDQWLVKKGKWLDPRKATDALAAFDPKLKASPTRAVWKRSERPSLISQGKMHDEKLGSSFLARLSKKRATKPGLVAKPPLLSEPSWQMGADEPPPVIQAAGNNGEDAGGDGAAGASTSSPSSGRSALPPIPQS